MKVQHTKSIIYFTETCKICHKDFRISVKDEQGICLKCHEKQKQEDYKLRCIEARRKADLELNLLIGAKVMSIKPTGYGHDWDITELEEIILQTESGKRIGLKAGNERYIGWEEF